MLQVAHGGQFNRGPKVNYLVAAVYPDRIDLEVKEIAVAHEGEDNQSSAKIQIADAAKAKGFTTIGAASLHRDRTGLTVSNATGCFERKQ